MYPDRTPIIQFETRRRALGREAHSIRETDRATQNKTVARPAVARPPVAPPRYKLALLTWAGAYALITLILALLGPVIASWPLLLRTLVLSVMMVVALTWLVMPRVTRLFRAWLTASA